MEVEKDNGTAISAEETNGVEAEDKETRRELEEVNVSLLEEREDVNRDTEVAPALVAVHPNNESIVVAVASDLRVFDLIRSDPASLANGSKELHHKDSIRAIRFSGSGKFLVSAGDDKHVKIWSTQTWQCLASLNSEKRVSAIAIGKDERFLCFADKFGVVWAVNLDGLENHSWIEKKPVAIFAHYCSIIPSLEFSPDGRLLVSADRDFKIRVTVFPMNPLNGAHEIQSFCLGHSEFVSCLAFVHNSHHPQGFVLSGSGDSTVCMWDISCGSLLSKCDVGSKAGVAKESQHAVTDLCAVPNSSLVAAALQSLQGILLLSCDLSARTVSVSKVVSISEETFIPTSLGACFSGELLWMVMGVSNLSSLNSSLLTRVRALSGFSKQAPLSELPNQNEPTILEDHEIPGGEKLLEKLQGQVMVEDKVLLAASEAVSLAMSNLLTKKQYPDEKREFRKRGRNDRKIKH